jgi:undecaprenyl diphosphate synthase
MYDRDAIARVGTPERAILDQIDPDRLPRHVAIIMDGNGRWARRRNLPRVEGHRAGIRAVRETIETSARLGLEVLTLYAFSTENWKRPRFEVLTLMGLLKEYLRRERDTLNEHNLRFRPIGRLESLDATVRSELDQAVEATQDNTGTLFQIALNYSGRLEITEAARAVAEATRSGAAEPETIDASWIEAHLYTAGVPDPDLLIRTSGEQRISNFLLWQAAYAEILFCDVLWPDFTTGDLLTAIVDYQRRERRYGGLNPADGDVFADGDQALP